jgi:hypothetical protein
MIRAFCGSARLVAVVVRCFVLESNALGMCGRTASVWRYPKIVDWTDVAGTRVRDVCVMGALLVESQTAVEGVRRGVDGVIDIAARFLVRFVVPAFECAAGGTLAASDDDLLAERED